MAASFDLTSYLDELRRLVEDALTRAIPAEAPAVIIEAMRYGLLGGGKRLRPCLTLAAADTVAPHLALDAPLARTLALPAACAVELIHSYSLIHDDLPAMDDDTLRRGRPTTHVVYGDGMAILAGDGLLTEAFTILCHAPARVSTPGAAIAPAERRLRAAGVLAEAAGPVGMVGGQAIDLVAAGSVLHEQPAAMDVVALGDMHARKTGALIRAATTAGAIMAGADDVVIDALDAYARDLGLAFQIVDDILDVEGSSADLGKTAGKDALAGKPTFPAFHGLEGSRRLARECVDRATARLADARLSGRLGDIAAWSLGRRH